MYYRPPRHPTRPHLAASYVCLLARLDISPSAAGRAAACRRSASRWLAGWASSGRRSAASVGERRRDEGNGPIPPVLLPNGKMPGGSQAHGPSQTPSTETDPNPHTHTYAHAHAHMLSIRPTRGTSPPTIRRSQRSGQVGWAGVARLGKVARIVMEPTPRACLGCAWLLRVLFWKHS